MTIWTTPQVYLIARPQIDFSEVERFLSDRQFTWLRSENASAAEEIVELSGRLCYMSFKGDAEKITYPNAKYIRNLVDKGHESVLEHATWSFIVDRVSRSFTHQLVRHRVGFAYSQLSQQYHDEGQGDFVQPVGLERAPKVAERWLAAVERSRKEYRELLDELTDTESPPDFETKRWLRSVARSLLPNATETAIAVTANARALRHFFDLRGSIPGDPEMRQVSVTLHEILVREAPALFADFEMVKTEDGVGMVRRKRNSSSDSPEAVV